MRDAENIRAVAQLDIDLMGFVFFPKSPRYVLEDPGFAERMQLKTMGGTCRMPEKVGVFVDEMPQNIITAAYYYGLHVIQLHGKETREFCENLRLTLDPDICPGVKIIKALSIKEPSDVDRYKAYEGAVDSFLFDTRCPTAGGSGKQFDWSVLDRYDGDTPFFLSGGIGPDDVARVKSFSHPRLDGIDLNSRFEISPALKDVEKLRAFIRHIRG